MLSMKVNSIYSLPIFVIKHDKQTVRIFGDYKLTANHASRMEHCPLPNVKDFLSTLAGGTLYLNH